MILNRVLNGDDFVLAWADPPEEGVQSGGFTRAGGAGQEDDAVGLMNLLVKDF